MGRQRTGEEVLAAVWSRVSLSGADLSRVSLSRVSLSGADLSEANLLRANLSGANLSGANLSRANLSRANLSRADLSGADLWRADLWRANLWRANLSGANLAGATLPAFQIPQEGTLIVWKKLEGDVLAKLLVPASAKRTATLVGRKCRAEFAEVLELVNCSESYAYDIHSHTVKYSVGSTVRPDEYDDDIRIECTHGIHFFLTREEAQAY